MAKPKNILLIEDSDDDEQLILRAFKKIRIANHIVVKRDGEEALRYFFDEQGQLTLNQEDFPQLILLDLHLPRISGIEVLQQLRSHPMTAHLPIAIFTSSDSEKDIVQAYSNGANSFVQKPIDME
ncbi:MAG: response regulator, partial [Ghiorsea sp.]